MGRYHQDKALYRYKLWKGSHRRDFSAKAPAPGDGAQLLLGTIASRARYPGWTFCVGVRGDSLWLEAYRSDPAEPTRLQRLGPWPIPADADEDRVFALVLVAVAETDGESARGEVEFLPPK